MVDSNSRIATLLPADMTGRWYRPKPGHGNCSAPAHLTHARRRAAGGEPPAAPRLSTLSRVDYEDAILFATGAAQPRTAEQWVRL
jgi:hypothetical protein